MRTASIIAVGSMAWSGKAPCQLAPFVYDHSDRRVCRHRAVAAAANMSIGVSQAGYACREELLVFLLRFSLSSAVALFVKWKCL